MEQQGLKKYKILFVCLGNICRSPSAEAVMKHVVEQRGLSHLFEIDSAGILSYHQGVPADQRMQQHARKRGFELTSISRPIKTDDFWHFDLIIGMDDGNIRDLYTRTPDVESSRKVVRMSRFFRTDRGYDHVPDPYYGGAQGFELVLDMLQEACDELVDQLLADDGELIENGN